jgi:hypothetical protein
MTLIRQEEMHFLVMQRTVEKVGMAPLLKMRRGAIHEKLKFPNYQPLPWKLPCYIVS